MPLVHHPADVALVSDDIVRADVAVVPLEVVDVPHERALEVLLQGELVAIAALGGVDGDRIH
jgi:hypothetical protein